jgi:hypothetical protein
MSGVLPYWPPKAPRHRHGAVSKRTRCNGKLHSHKREKFFTRDTFRVVYTGHTKTAAENAKEKGGRSLARLRLVQADAA